MSAGGAGVPGGSGGEPPVAGPTSPPAGAAWFCGAGLVALLSVMLRWLEVHSRRSLKGQLGRTTAAISRGNNDLVLRMPNIPLAWWQWKSRRADEFLIPKSESSKSQSICSAENLP